MPEFAVEDVEAVMDAVNVLQPEATPYLRYSGRGMFGDTCFGIVCSSPSQAMLSLGQALGEEELDEGLVEAFSDHRQDSMGVESIIYFPAITVSEETADEWEQSGRPTA